LGETVVLNGATEVIAGAGLDEITHRWGALSRFILAPATNAVFGGHRTSVAPAGFNL
jgi:hypothetical protein